MGWMRCAALSCSPAKDRCKRIVLPLLTAWPLVFAGIIVVIVWIALIKFGGELPKESPPGPKFTPDDFPLTHRWFLYVLTRPGAVLLLAAPLAFALASLPKWPRVVAAAAT